MEHGPFEDVYPVENVVDFAMAMFLYQSLNGLQSPSVTPAASKNKNDFREATIMQIKTPLPQCHPRK